MADRDAFSVSNRAPSRESNRAISQRPSQRCCLFQQASFHSFPHLAEPNREVLTQQRGRASMEMTWQSGDFGLRWRHGAPTFCRLFEGDETVDGDREMALNLVEGMTRRWRTWSTEGVGDLQFVSAFSWSCPVHNRPRWNKTDPMFARPFDALGSIVGTVCGERRIGVTRHFASGEHASSLHGVYSIKPPQFHAWKSGGGHSSVMVRRGHGTLVLQVACTLFSLRKRSKSGFLHLQTQYWDIGILVGIRCRDIFKSVFPYVRDMLEKGVKNSTSRVFFRARRASASRSHPSALTHLDGVCEIHAGPMKPPANGLLIAVVQ